MLLVMVYLFVEEGLQDSSDEGNALIHLTCGELNSSKRHIGSG
jgi:hypothetical protein